MEIPEFIIFNGIEFKLMGGKRKYYLSQSNTNQGRKNPKGLHVAIWEFHNKTSVPKGWHVHHVDGNTFNNDIENLHCIPASEHFKMPKNYDRKVLDVSLEKAREKAKLWHKSPEGREWHRKHAREIADNPKFHEYRCIICGNVFFTRKGGALCCSQSCRDKKKRRKELEARLQSKC
jgi:hypothetical protein